MRKLLAAFFVCVPGLALADLSSFPAAVSTHLKAIEARDPIAFETTITKDSTFTFVALNGAATTTRDAFLRQMRAWLSDSDWSWKLEPLSLSGGPHVGVAVYKVTYQDLDPQGRPYSLKYVLSLVFAKQDAEWRLVHDQNTRLPPN
jgi:ketosteroid isomerase-like protein